MAFLRFKKRLRAPADTGRAQKAKKTIKRVPPVAMEVKVLAIEAETDYKTLKNKLDKSSADLKELPYIHSLLLKDHGDSETVKYR